MNPTSSRNAKPEAHGRMPRRWVYIVVGFLAGHVVLMTTAVTLAVRGHGALGVTPDYYQQAVSWDESRAIVKASEALGWDVSVTPDIWLDDALTRRVTVHANDHDGRGITDAVVALKAYHRLYPGLTAEGTAAEDAPGVFALRLPLAKPGEWRITVRIERGDDVYEMPFDQNVVAPPAPVVLDEDQTRGPA